MTGVQLYFYRLIAGAGFFALLQAILRDGRMKQTVQIVCGCFFALLVLQPLLPLSNLNLDELYMNLHIGETFDQETAQEKNQALLSRLVAQQTEEYIQKCAREQGANLSVSVDAQMDPERQIPVPVSAILTGAVTPEQRQVLSRILSEELNIPLVRQEWKDA